MAASVLAAPSARDNFHALETLTPEKLATLGLAFPLIVNPVRGRGSQGVTLVDDHAAFQRASAELIDSGRFGDELIVEQFLNGTEMTVTVMPQRIGHDGLTRAPWPLPPVRRFNHAHDVAPYNGIVAVTSNSIALTRTEQTEPVISAMFDACVHAARLVEARAPIRIDCRADADGTLRLFDLNMKPNMTGAGRPAGPRRPGQPERHRGARVRMGLQRTAAAHAGRCVEGSVMCRCSKAPQRETAPAHGMCAGFLPLTPARAARRRRRRCG